MPPADRRAFVAERRAASAHRFDTINSPRYDENWGAVSPSHAAHLLLAREEPSAARLVSAQGNERIPKQPNGGLGS